MTAVATAAQADDLAACPTPPTTGRCQCGHVRAAHVGRAVLYRDPEDPAADPALVLDPTGRHWRAWPDACALMICRCEIFRGETDR